MVQSLQYPFSNFLDLLGEIPVIELKCEVSVQTAGTVYPLNIDLGIDVESLELGSSSIVSYYWCHIWWFGYISANLCKRCTSVR